MVDGGWVVMVVMVVVGGWVVVAVMVVAVAVVVVSVCHVLPPRLPPHQQ